MKLLAAIGAIMMVAGAVKATEIETDPPLRELAEARGLLIGPAVSARAFDPSDIDEDEQYIRVLVEQFNILTAENAMKPRALSVGPGEYDWSTADAMFDLAERHGMKVRFHTGLWHNAQPRWLNEDDTEQARTFARAHITAVGERYGDQMAYWDVVNEPIDHSEPDNLRDSVWKRAMGDDYLHQIYRLAHAVAPETKLVLNDHNVLRGGPKGDGMYEVAKGMLEAGVPLHAAGFQAHHMSGQQANREQILANLRRFADLGLEIHITEMDVAIKSYEGSHEEKLQRQAEVYRTVLSACLELETFTVFQTWGFTDKHSWVHGRVGERDAPLLFDENYQPKPAYQALREVLDAGE